MKADLKTSLDNFCENLISEFEKIPESRRELLQRLGTYIFQKVQRIKAIQLVVICTHNSRRSHIGQLWLQVAAQWYDIPNVHTFSGGTEATAFNKNAIAALQRAGFEFETVKAGENPVYQTTIAIKEPITLELFSKTYDRPPNPTKDFAAIMVCSEADEGCPFVPGADARFAIPFEDPKRGDGTPQETQKYDEAVRHIGREFFYVIHQAATLLKN